MTLDFMQSCYIILLLEILSNYSIKYISYEKPGADQDKFKRGQFKYTDEY